MAIPNLFIIGASKCGTTSLYDDLVKTDQVGRHVYNTKEPMLFNRDIYSKGSDFISNCFESDFNYILDASTIYSVCKYTAVRILQTCGGSAKFIFCYRNRFERIKSHWNMINNYRPGRESHFSEAICRNIESFRHTNFEYEYEYMPYLDYKGGCYIPYYIEASMYYDCIVPYLILFNRKNFFFFNLDEDIKPQYENLSSFLDIDVEYRETHIRKSTRNAFDKSELLPDAYNFLERLFEKDQNNFESININNGVIAK